MKLHNISMIHVEYLNVRVPNSMGKLYNGTAVLEGSSDSTVTRVFDAFILELCSISLEMYHSGNYAGISASALEVCITGNTIN